MEAEQYEVECTVVVMATSAIDAFDQVKAMFDDIATIHLTDSANAELFQELGVKYD